MIDINELRMMVHDFKRVGSPRLLLQTTQMGELLDRLEAAESEAIEQARLNGMGAERELALMAKLEAAEKERDALRSLVVMRFDHDHPPQFTQGYDTHELTEPVTAEHCRWFVAEIERLRAEVAHIKEVEFPRKAQAVADGWRGKCERLEAKIEQMEKQAPAYWGPKHAIEGGSTTVIVGKFPVNPTDAPLYALPGAKGE